MSRLINLVPILLLVSVVVTTMSLSGSQRDVVRGAELLTETTAVLLGTEQRYMNRVRSLKAPLKFRLVRAVLISDSLPSELY